MTAGAPAWGSWMTFYDSVDQAPSMARGDSEDGLVVSFGMDRLQLSLRVARTHPSLARLDCPAR